MEKDGNKIYCGIEEFGRPRKPHKLEIVVFKSHSRYNGRILSPSCERRRVLKMPCMVVQNEKLVGNLSFVIQSKS